MVPIGARVGSPRGLVGLQNEGNTCFLNSVLQCLSNVPDLTGLFLAGSPRVNPGSETRGRLAMAYGDLIRSMWSESSARHPMATCQRPSAVKSVVGRVARRFLGYEQQDAHEFLRFCVETLNQDLRRGRGKAPFREMKDPADAADSKVADAWWAYDEEREGSPIRDIFAGQLRGAVECQRCGYLSRSFDAVWDLQLPIPRKAQKSGGGGLFGFGSRSSGGKGCSLADCLDEYTGEERMRGEGTWRCAKCKASDSVRRTQLWRLPTVLVLQFKRFTFSTFRRSKVSTSVALPGKALDLGPYLARGASGAGAGRRPVYELVGASNHSGSIHGGHYTADCRNHDDGRWYRFNDSHVSSSNGVSGSAAYIAFYRLADADGAAAGRSSGKSSGARL